MHDEDLIAFTRTLIHCPSPPGEEEQVVALAVAEMRALGYDHVWVDDNGSAIGSILCQEPGPTLLLDGHCDTVGIAPGVPWRHEPFGAQIEDGWLYGRGAVDMKGALAAMIYAAAHAARSRLAGRIVVSASVMEEVFEGAALRAVMEAVRPDFVLIGEPSDLRLVRGGRGRAEIQLETIGVPAHSSTPHLGRNAVHDMIKVIQAMEAQPLPSDPILGAAVQALTDIKSDPYPGYSVIPSRCRATYDRRLLVGETAAAILGAITAEPALAGIELRATIAQGEHRTYTGAVLSGEKFFPAWLLPEDHPFLRAAMEGLPAVGLQAEVDVYRFCTNAAYSAGVAQVPTLGYGPGQAGQAHVIDERLAVASLLDAARGYRGIIEAILRPEAGR